ncbi:MAG TPA: TetR/AcrR family transcriptional regulator [Bacteroidia bacterium]|nr:TetR/AcrR family transcriptional regulator [Bacteroidia bacterium]
MDTREQILVAAQKLFFRNGIRSVSMDDIAADCGISKKTIYQIFTDKDELVHELMKEKLIEDEKSVRAIHESCENVIEELLNISKHMEKVFSQIHSSIFYDLQKYYPKTWALFTGFKESCILKTVEESLIKGIKQGLIRPEIDIKILTRMRMEQISMSFSPTVFPPEQFSQLKVHLSLLDHFLYGICTLKGHKLINKYKQITEEE